MGEEDIGRIVGPRASWHLEDKLGEGGWEGGFGGGAPVERALRWLARGSTRTELGFGFTWLRGADAVAAADDTPAELLARELGLRFDLDLWTRFAGSSRRGAGALFGFAAGGHPNARITDTESHTLWPAPEVKRTDELHRDLELESEGFFMPRFGLFFFRQAGPGHLSGGTILQVLPRYFGHWESSVQCVKPETE